MKYVKSSCDQNVFPEPNIYSENILSTHASRGNRNRKPSSVGKKRFPVGRTTVQFALGILLNSSTRSLIFILFLMVTLSCTIATEQPDLEATVNARVAAAKASWIPPTPIPLPTYTPVPTPTPTIIIKEIIVEKPVEILVEKLVVKEVPLEPSEGVVPVIQFVEVIKEVPVEIITEILVEVVATATATATPLPIVNDSFDIGDEVSITLTFQDKETGEALSETDVWLYHTLRDGTYYWPDEMLIYGIEPDKIDTAVKNVGNTECSCWHIRTNPFGQISLKTYIPGAPDDEILPHLHIAWIDGYGDGVLVFEMSSPKRIGPITTIYHQNVFPLKIQRGQRGWESTTVVEKFKID